MRYVLAICIMLLASTVQADNQVVIDVDREAEKAWKELILATEDPKPGESEKVSELRQWIQWNLDHYLTETAKVSPPTK